MATMATTHSPTVKLRFQEQNRKEDPFMEESSWMSIPMMKFDEFIDCSKLLY